MDITEIAALARQPAANTPRSKPRPERAEDRQLDVQAVSNGPALAAGQSLATSLTGRSVASPKRHSLLLEQVVGAPPSDDETISTTPAPSPPRPIAQGMTHDLGRALSEAVGLGLLSPNNDIAGTDQPPQSIIEDAFAATGSAQDTDISGRLTIIDSVAAARGAMPLNLPDNSVATCPPSDIIDPSQWQGQTLPLHAPGGTALIFNETDALDPEGTRNLAKQYLYLGFGAEARLVLSMLETQQPQDRFLEIISHLVDLAPLPPELSPLDIGSCGGIATLWQALSILPQDLPENYPVANMVQAIQTLPAHLRLHLGPHIVRHIAAQGFISGAQSIRDSLDRISETHSEPLRLAQATLDLPRASDQDTQRLEQDLMADPTLDALTFLLQRQQDLNLPISFELAAEAQSLLRALRGSDEGHVLAELLAKGLSRSEKFADALSLVRLNDADIPSPENTALLEDILLELSNGADDTTFVTQVFEHTPWNAALSEDARDVLANRLSLLGFGDQADLLKRAPNPAPEDPVNVAEDPIANAPETAQTVTDAPTLSTAAMINDIASIPSDMQAPLNDQEIVAPRSDDAMDLELAQSSIPSAGADFDLQSGLLSAGHNTVRDSTRLRERLRDVLQSGP